MTLNCTQQRTWLIDFDKHVDIVIAFVETSSLQCELRVRPNSSCYLDWSGDFMLDWQYASQSR